MSSLAPLALFGLLYVAESPTKAVNLKARNGQDPLHVYLANAVALQRSLARQQLPFTLLTNSRRAIEALYDSRPDLARIQIVELVLESPVPKGIPFYSAHFKIDVYRYFGSLGQGAYVGLLDLDMVALGDVPPALETLVSERIAACYDISDQVLTAFRPSRVRADLSRFTRHAAEGRWVGGECLFGPPAFFAELARKIDAIFPAYAACYAELHHQGDEMLVSAALEDIRRDGTYVAELGALGIVARYWSVPVSHGQKAFRWYKNAFLLHLPADKDFLADVATRGSFDSSDFRRRYFVHRLRKAPINALKALKLLSKARFR
ncbi:MAG: hypothetical protein RL385_5096 [Pseudomonadota bacterium]